MSSLPKPGIHIPAPPHTGDLSATEPDLNSYKSPCLFHSNWQPGSSAAFPQSSRLHACTSIGLEMLCVPQHSQSLCMLSQASNMQNGWDVSTGTQNPCSEELFKAAHSSVTALNGGVWPSAMALCTLHDLPVSHFFSPLTTWGQCLGYHRLVEKKFGLYSKRIQHVLSVGWDSAPGLQG